MQTNTETQEAKTEIKKEIKKDLKKVDFGDMSYLGIDDDNIYEDDGIEIDTTPIENQVGVVVIKREKLRAGFIKVPKFGKVYFKEQDDFCDTSFDKLSLGDRVKLTVTNTKYGPVASNIKLFPLKSKTLPDLSR